VSTDARSISGVVRDAAGRPAAQARVYFLRGPVALPDTALLTGRDGRFALSAPQPGAYDVGCSSDAHGSASARVTVGNADVTLDLQLPR
jgi:hypothetical protein